MPETLSTIHPGNYRFLQDRVYAKSGIVLGPDKHYLLESRLSPIVRQLGLGSINDLCALMMATRGNDVDRQVIDAMTTNETFFFRDPAHYEAIRTHLLPRLREERKDSRRMRFWSAAASTGQEAYSLAMMLLSERLEDWKLEILGTDLSSLAVDRAREGIYQQIEISRGLPPGLLQKHFHSEGPVWKLDDRIRRMVTFESVDLRRGMQMKGPFDVVFCRNVLIYFDAETKKNILRELHGTLFRGGWLLMGGAETIFGMDDLFQKQQISGAAVYVAR